MKMLVSIYTHLIHFISFTSVGNPYLQYKWWRTGAKILPRDYFLAPRGSDAYTY